MTLMLKHIRGLWALLEVISVETDDGLTDRDFSRLSDLVSLEKREKAARLRSRQGAVNLLMGEALARNAVCGRAGLPYEELAISSNRYGKPYPVNAPGVYFNISHTGDLVVCAVSCGEVGVDVELVNRADMSVAKRFFSSDEYEYVISGGEISEIAFCEIWTKKESYVKWEGKGLSTQLNSFSVLEIGRVGRPVFHAVRIREDVRCHVCTDAGRIGSHRHYKQSELLEILFA